MDVRLVCDTGVERHGIEEHPQLLERQDAVVWVDILLCDQEAVNVLSRVFGFHPIAVRDCTERNHVSKVHIYPDYVFSVLHAPKLGKRGHVRYVELDQFVGPKYLVTEARHDHTRKGVADMQAHSSAQATKAGRAPVSNHTMRAGRRHRRG